MHKFHNLGGCRDQGLAPIHSSPAVQLVVMRGQWLCSIVTHTQTDVDHFHPSLKAPMGTSESLTNKERKNVDSSENSSLGD